MISAVSSTSSSCDSMASRMPRVRFQKDKACTTKKKRGRVKIAEYDTEALRNSLERYLKSVGMNHAFDLHSYKSLPVSFAARGNDLVKMHLTNGSLPFFP